MKRCLFISIIICLLSPHAKAQYPPVIIPGSETRKITSQIVPGQEYELQILLPGGYKEKKKNYTVVYLMDSQWDFPLVKSIYGQHYYDGFIPELIIVGITWGGVDPNPDSLRARDYTPTKEERLLQSGGADKFLEVMKSEIFPFMKKNYQVSDDRVLMGCSLGGLFTLYTLFTHTDMFSGYAAASPAIGWDREVLYQFEKEFEKKKLTTPVRLYMTVGDVERGKSGFERFANLMKSKNHENVSIISKVLENTGHSGTKSETYSRGLQFIFKRNQLQLNENILNKYAGTYQMENGNRIELKKEGKSLYWYYSPQNKVELYANTETHLYALHEFFNLYFIETANKVEGFEWARYGSTIFLKKIN